MSVGGAPRTVRMAVLSDPHGSSHEAARTWVRENQGDPAWNPLAGIRELARTDDDLRADVLLCPGDLCDQADWSSLPYVWRELEAVAAEFGAGQVVATVGNHDIDTREIHKGSSIEQGLRDLDPDFPAREPANVAPYWDDRITVVRGTDWQVVSLNSSLMRQLAKDEKDHGSIDDPTLDTLGVMLAGSTFPVNVLLCHHHPQPFTRLDPADRSHMAGGDRLVRLLNDLPETWMVIHGHKHEPHLDYLEGTGGSPVRLAAGSVGANLWPILAHHVRNQLHLVEFPIDDGERLELGLCGEVRSWTWRPRTRWHPALPEGDGLPPVAGFGYRRGGAELAAELVRRARENALEVVERATLVAWDSRVNFLLPDDIRALRERLRSDHGGHVSLTEDGHLDRVVLPRP